MPEKRRVLGPTILVYAVLLILSHTVRWAADTRQPEPSPGIRTVELGQVQLALEDLAGTASPERRPVLLIHGSPGRGADFRKMAAAMKGSRRILIPDLPGFGHSTRNIPDYSIRSHAEYLAQFLERERIEQVHVVGFSMGGGVALNLYDLAPNRVASVTLLSAIGVQELELSGHYRLNHLIHGAQLTVMRLILEGLPHFGLLDGGMMDIPYARNFYDSDQRPLRRILTELQPPVKIIHGREDILVPFAVAEEHHRIVPHSELHATPFSHFMVFSRGEMLATVIGEFLLEVEAGRMPWRDDADPARIAQSQQLHESSDAPAATGVALLVLMLLIALATMVSEDLTCIVTGLMVAQGRIGFLPGALACFIGIFIGDVMLFLAGRWIGRAAIHRAPLKWFLTAERVEQGSRWFNRRGPVVIALSRFTPGTRLPTYFAAGMFQTGFLKFCLYFILAAGAWTPILVALAMFAGSDAVAWLGLAETYGLPVLIGLAILLFILVRMLVPLLTWRGRKRMQGRLTRIRHWEFWPPWMFYPPIVLHILWLGLKHRSMTLFTAANPGIPSGGFIAESKSDILDSLEGNREFIARHIRIPVAASLKTAQEFMAREQLDFPVVLKPDIGQRGSGVKIIRNSKQLESGLSSILEPMILQEYAPGPEFGVFWYCLPGESKGTIFSITEKVIPDVTGDGRQTLEQLILNDKRAVAMAKFYLKAHPDAADRTPNAGERVRLAELGTHCRGAVFLDGMWVNSPELEAAIEQISSSFEGFWFGRYDIRTRTAEELTGGRNFKIIELNGVTSEATHIYDRRTSLWEAWKTLVRQWDIAFEIGKRNRERGAEPTSIRELFRLMKHYRTEAVRRN
ncbi:MAG: alpha/beta fold hydrolase [Acidobacteria bacterium]|uniref:Alpha/beta fold hydrolase n=1 Tax=Candidatus Polarisedimenticola svalbardensis TaxID=2886004 RepID=A0A8J6XTA4_9BACT|nr:alpha/beta fold hydrolase [Candidatus Polarisedimenticola svalbardensis]